MKIGIVCYPTYGGSGVVATELGKALAQKGHQVHFITYKQPFRLDTFSDNIFFHEVAVSDYPLFEYPPYQLVLTGKLVDVALYEKLDLIHVHYAIPHAAAAYMARQILKEKGIYLPFVTTLHGTDITLVGRDASFEPSISFSINHSNAVTAVSKDLAKDTLKQFHIEKEIKVVPNFINIEDYDEVEADEVLRKKIAPNGEKIILHTSNFRPVKRVEDVVRVFTKIHKECDSKLILVGDGPDRSKIETLCRTLGVCDDIKFVGKLKNTTKALKLADLFLLTSETESFGLVALEAMAAKVPVISTNVGGLPEVNEQGVSGFLSPVGDIDDMANNALNILKDEKKLKAMKESAYQRAKKFDISGILPLYEQIYQDVVEEAKERMKSSLTEKES